MTKKDLIKLYEIHTDWADLIYDYICVHNKELTSALSEPFTPINKYDIFRVFSMGIKDIKCVIFGQDPYPNERAIGRSFAYPKKFSTPPSFQVINQQLNKLGYESPDSTLESWENQGVMLLNQALTCPYKTGGHAELWQPFMEQVLEKLNTKDIVYLLWGKNALKMKDYIKKGYIHISCHPIAERYSGGKLVFNGGFIEANEYLASTNKSTIQWGKPKEREEKKQ